jgi:hypothetical protein
VIEHTACRRALLPMTVTSARAADVVRTIYIPTGAAV